MIKVYTRNKKIWLEFSNKYFLVDMEWDVLVNRIGLYNFLLELIPTLAEVSPLDLNTPFNPPIGSQELWAAGVTYFPWAPNKFGLDIGGGYNFDKVTALVGYDLLNKKPQASIGYTNTYKPNAAAPLTCNPGFVLVGSVCLGV